MKNLTELEYSATFCDPMQRLPLDLEPPFDFWIYFDSIPTEDFSGHDCSAGTITYAWTDATGRFQHVLVNSEDKNIFMVLILDLSNSTVVGHRLLDLNKEYALE